MYVKYVWLLSSNAFMYFQRLLGVFDESLVCPYGLTSPLNPTELTQWVSSRGRKMGSWLHFQFLVLFQGDSSKLNHINVAVTRGTCWYQFLWSTSLFVIFITVESYQTTASSIKVTDPLGPHQVFLGPLMKPKGGALWRQEAVKLNRGVFLLWCRRLSNSISNGGEHLAWLHFRLGETWRSCEPMREEVERRQILHWFRQTPPSSCCFC